MAYFYHHFSDNYIDLPEKLEILLSNAHKMKPPFPQCFVYAYFTVGNLKINQIKMYNRVWGM